MKSNTVQTRAGVAKSVNVCYSAITFAGYVIKCMNVLSTHSYTSVLAYAYKTKERKRDKGSEAT